ncbi:MAG TPA: hypothetical protein VGI20_00785 [Rhizomicrobium sp.]
MATNRAHSLALSPFSTGGGSGGGANPYGRSIEAGGFCGTARRGDGRTCNVYGCGAIFGFGK